MWAVREFSNLLLLYMQITQVWTGLKVASRELCIKRKYPRSFNTNWYFKNVLSLLHLFSVISNHNTILQQANVKNGPSSIWQWDSNSLTWVSFKIHQNWAPVHIATLFTILHLLLPGGKIKYALVHKLVSNTGPLWPDLANFRHLSNI